MCLLCSISTIQSQTSNNNTAQKPLINPGEIDYGSARWLDKSVVLTYVVFIAEPRETWTKEEKQRKLKYVDEAMNWIKKEGSRYGKIFEHATYPYRSLDETIIFDTVYKSKLEDERSPDHDLLYRILQKTGFQNHAHFYGLCRQNVTFTDLQFLIFAKGKGVSHAFRYQGNHWVWGRQDPDKHFIESAVIYDKDENGNENAAATTAHEILHLFGVSDLYANKQWKKANELTIRQNYPKSIMLSFSRQDLNTFEIDYYSAWYLKWHNKAEPFFYKLMRADTTRKGDFY